MENPPPKRKFWTRGLGCGDWAIEDSAIFLYITFSGNFAWFSLCLRELGHVIIASADPLSKNVSKRNSQSTLRPLMINMIQS